MPGIDSYTKLCIISDGVVGGETTFNDLSLSGHTIFVEGDTHHDSSDPLFGLTAINTDSSGDYLYVDPSDDWEFGTGDYTLELRRKTTSGSGILFYCSYYHNAETNTWSEILLDLSSGGTVAFQHNYYSNGSLAGYKRITNTTTVITDGEYHAIMLVRTGGVYKLFIDGTIDGTVTSYGSVVSLLDNGYDSHIMYLLGTYSFSASALSDQIRISKGIARETSNYTPSTESFDERIFGLVEYDTPLASFEATGTFPTFGFGEFNTPAPWLSSVGNNPILGYVEYTPPLPSFTAAEMSLGYVEIDTPVVSLLATGSFPIYAYVEFDTRRMSLDATGTSQVFGFGNINTKLVALFAESGGDVRMNSKAVSLASTGVMAYPGFGNINTPRVSLSSYGTQSLAATVNMTPLLPKLISRSTGSSGYEVIKYRR